MERFKFLAISALASMLFVTPAAAADVINENTGPNSSNKASIKIENKSEVVIENDADISNCVTLDAVTGNNEVVKNTEVGNIETGDIDVAVEIDNEANETEVVVDNGGIGGGVIDDDDDDDGNDDGNGNGEDNGGIGGGDLDVPEVTVVEDGIGGGSVEEGIGGGELPDSGSGVLILGTILSGLGATLFGRKKFFKS